RRARLPLGAGRAGLAQRARPLHRRALGRPDQGRRPRRLAVGGGGRAGAPGVGAPGHGQAAPEEEALSRYPTVPPAVVPSNKDEVARTDRQIRVARTRQATFERGVALALVASMSEQLGRLTTLKTGLRWLLQEEDCRDVARWLERLQEDLLRAERIQEREVESE